MGISEMLLAGLFGFAAGILIRSVRPVKRIDVWPINYVMFSPVLSDADRPSLLDQAAQAVRQRRLSASSIRSDEESRAAFYDQLLKSGLVPPESHSTSSRNSRGPQ